MSVGRAFGRAMEGTTDYMLTISHSTPAYHLTLSLSFLLAISVSFNV